MTVQGTGPRGSALTLGAPNLSTVLAELLPQSGSSTASLTTINNISFSQKVEKHISDYRSGQGYLSSDVGNEIQARGEALANTLDPKASRNFTAYQTGLRYDQRARYLNNLSSALSKLKNIVA